MNKRMVDARKLYVTSVIATALQLRSALVICEEVAHNLIKGEGTGNLKQLDDIERDFKEVVEMMESEAQEIAREHGDDAGKWLIHFTKDLHRKFQILQGDICDFSHLENPDIDLDLENLLNNREDDGKTE